VTHLLQVGSGVVVIVIVLGLWMLWRRWPRRTGHHAHHHAPNPVAILSAFAPGDVSIIDTPNGERMCYTCTTALPDLRITVEIARAGGVVELLDFVPQAEKPGVYLSTAVPAEPHEFTATAIISVGEQNEHHPFAMHEPEGHDDLNDDAHARAHAAAMPADVATGGRPTAGRNDSVSGIDHRDAPRPVCWTGGLGYYCRALLQLGISRSVGGSWHDRGGWSVEAGEYGQILVDICPCAPGQRVVGHRHRRSCVGVFPLMTITPASAL
jgi:hypothetical protein